MAVYRANVTRVTGDGVFVRVPDLGIGYEFGPMPEPTNVLFAADDPVIVSSIGSAREDLAILAGQGAGAVTLSLTDLTDVTLTSPANGHVLQYNGTQWVNKATLDLINTPGTADTLTVRVTGDTHPRFVVNADGSLNWGGGSGSVDTDLARNIAGLLLTGGSISAVGQLYTFTGVNVAGSSGFTQTDFGGSHSWLSILKNPARIEFGSGSAARDVLLERDAANVLRLDDEFKVQRGSASDTAHSVLVTGDSVLRYRILADGKMSWGSGSGVHDTNLYRSGANVLKTDDEFESVIGFTSAGAFKAVRAAAGDDAFRAQVAGDSDWRVIVNTGGTVEWGSGSAGVDTSLLRSAASTLLTPGKLLIGSSQSAVVGGRVATAGPRTSNSSGFTTTETSVDSVTLSSPESGRTYKIYWFGQIQSSAADGYVRGRIREDSTSGTQLVLRQLHTATVANQSFPLIMEAEWTAPSGSSKTFHATLVRQSGTGTITATASSDTPTLFYVDYVRG